MSEEKQALRIYEDDLALEALSNDDSGISPATKRLLSETADLFVEHVHGIFSSKVELKKLKTSDLIKLGGLVMTRAWGAPEQRAVNLNVSAEYADAVAASLGGLHAQLPEQRGVIDVSPEAAPETDSRPVRRKSAVTPAKRSRGTRVAGKKNAV